MYTLPTSNYLRRSLLVNHSRIDTKPIEMPTNHIDKVRAQLLDVGASKLSLYRMDSRYVPHIIHPDETIKGTVYGRFESGNAMLIATDRRVIFLDKKPMYVNEDEVTYNIVSGVDFGHVGIGATVTLHTRVKDYKIRTLNEACAKNFVSYIESRCLEQA
jgi:hypothetical protein